MISLEVSYTQLRQAQTPTLLTRALTLTLPSPNLSRMVCRKIVGIMLDNVAVYRYLCLEWLIGKMKNTVSSFLYIV